MTNSPVVLGIDFGGTKIAAAVCDAAGNKLASAVVASLGERGARASFGHGLQTARELLVTAAPMLRWPLWASRRSASRLTTGWSWPRSLTAGKAWSWAASCGRPSRRGRRDGY